MLIWLAESSDTEKNIIDGAIRLSLVSNRYQEQCSIIRHLIKWEIIKKNILIKITN